MAGRAQRAHADRGLAAQQRVDQRHGPAAARSAAPNVPGTAYVSASIAPPPASHSSSMNAT